MVIFKRKRCLINCCKILIGNNYLALSCRIRGVIWETNFLSTFKSWESWELKTEAAVLAAVRAT